MIVIVVVAEKHMEGFLKALYGGIRLDIPGHGGAECAAYLSTGTKIAETCLSTVMMLVCLAYSLKHISLPSKPPPENEHVLAKPLLALLSIIIGLEISYKITSGELLYILNPCHVLTVVEVSDVVHSTIGISSSCTIICTLARTSLEQ